MNFSSPIFLFVFLPIILIGFFVLPLRWRKPYLCLVSGFFYAWSSPINLLILLIFIGINYLLVIIIGKNLSDKAQKGNVTFWIAIYINLLFLAYVKYSGFIGTSLEKLGLPHLISTVDNVPLGISFYVFSALSYHFDLYYGKIVPSPNILDYSFYILFFPKLIQGPITRFRQLQNLNFNRRFDLEMISGGCIQFVIGLAKKVLLADQLSPLVDKVFQVQVAQVPIAVAWLGAIAFTFQIYFDFSGYSDMAIGVARIFGYRLPENFSYPYISHSITEFWRRWHISLGQFFRDYVFLPLEMQNRHRRFLRFEINTLIVFFLTGLWHGANWQFIIWGIWQGAWIIFENQAGIKKAYQKMPGYLSWGITTIVIIIGWVLFRAPDLSSGIHLLKVMLGAAQTEPSNLNIWWYLDVKIAVLLVVCILSSLPFIPNLFSRLRISGGVRNIISYFGFFTLLVLSLIQVMSSSLQTFIYFKF